MKRSPLKRKTPLKRGKGLRPKSAKRTHRIEAWWHHDYRQRVIERDRDCVVKMRAIPAPTPCEPGRRQVHHVLTRARGGGDELSNLVLLCPHHHEWAHSHPREAQRLGLLRSQFTKENSE